MWDIQLIDGKDDEYKITSNYITFAIYLSIDIPHMQYAEINNILEKFGFNNSHSGPYNLYYGNSQCTCVTACLALQELAKKIDWFKSCVKEARLLSLIANDDMMRLIK